MRSKLLCLLPQKVIVPAKYTDFANVFLKKLAKVLPKQTSINKHDIKLINDKHPFYGLIYSLGLIELESFKTYIKTKSKILSNLLNLLFVLLSYLSVSQIAVFPYVSIIKGSIILQSRIRIY